MLEKNLYQPIPYEHDIFPVGTKVYIDTFILKIHVSHSAAGKNGIVIPGVYYPILELFENRPQKSYVPVLIEKDGKISLVEEEYVIAY